MVLRHCVEREKKIKYMNVYLNDSRGQVTVFAVHVVGTGTGVVSQPDAKVLDFQGLLLRDFFNADNLAGGLQLKIQTL